MANSVYIHIPFCKNICTYCDFCKIYYYEDIAKDYIKALKKEIEEIYDKEQIKEFTFEFNVSDIEENKLKFLKDNKVNRISIGIETISEDGQRLLDRKCSKDDIKNKINLVKDYFDNINIDIIYAYKDESIKDLKKDLDFITGFNPTHVYCYSLIFDELTILDNINMNHIDEELDSEMY